MRWGLLLATLTAAAGCAQPSPPMRKAAETVAELRKQAREFDPEHPCRTPRYYHGGAWVQYWGNDCYVLYPAEVMHGVWYYGFEERTFVRNVDRVPLYRVLDREGLLRAFETELDIDAEEALRRLRIRPEDHRPGTVAIAITFVGRRATPYRTPSGHQVQTIVVDAVLSGRLLGQVITRLDIPGCEGACAAPR